jgi:hypothetical protein
LFDPTILEALEAVGYDRSMDDIRSDEVRALGVSDQERLSHHTASAFRAIQLDEAD